MASPNTQKTLQSNKAQNTKTQLKKNIFKFPQYDKFIGQLKSFIQELNSQEKNKIKKGRYKDNYEQLSKCLERKAQGKTDCFKQVLHQKCTKQFKDIAEAVQTPQWKQNKNLRLQMTGNYFYCIDKHIRTIYLTSVVHF